MAASRGRPRHGSRTRSQARRRRLKRETRHLRIAAKRARRRFRQIRRAPWSARLWWEQFPLELAAIEGNLPLEYGNFTRGRIGRALVYHGIVELEAIGITRKLTVIFRGRPSRTPPIVMADGPKESRHRFYWARPSSLCLWYARDPESFRWTVNDRLVGLIDVARLHLIKEAWWRATREWSGFEVHRRSPAGDEQRPRASKSEIGLAKRKRVARQRCWCGSGRYSKCHGAIPAEEESAILGFS